MNAYWVRVVNSLQNNQIMFDIECKIYRTSQMFGHSVLRCLTGTVQVQKQKSNWKIFTDGTDILTQPWAALV